MEPKLMEVPVRNVDQMKVWFIRTVVLPAIHVDIRNVVNLSS